MASKMNSHKAMKLTKETTWFQTWTSINTKLKLWPSRRLSMALNPLSTCSGIAPYLWSMRLMTFLFTMLSSTTKTLIPVKRAESEAAGPPWKQKLSNSSADRCSEKLTLSWRVIRPFFWVDGSVVLAPSVAFPKEAWGVCSFDDFP